MRRVLLVLLFGLSAFANQRVTIFCMQGGHFVVTNGVPSVTQVEQSYPVCTMTVYPAGSNTPVPGSQIYSDNSNTVKGNPFNADQTGVGFFYAANGRYDVVISGGQGGGLPAPYTIGDILLQDNASGGSITSVTGSSGVSCNTVSGAVTCTNSGVTSNVAGIGIGVSGPTGAVTITNNGVTSFNSRTGAVSPQSADYAFSQIGGAKQGNTNVPQMAGTNSGVLGATLCDDAGGNATTTGCSGGGGGGSSGYILVSSVNFSQNPAGTLTAATPATVTLTPCPTGVSGTDSSHYYYISGTGTPEAVLGTGGSCVSGAGSGTLTFTPANNHTAGWTISSASGGLQECFNDGVILGSPFGCVLTTNITEYADVTAPTVSNWELLGIGQPVITLSGAGYTQTVCGTTCRNGIFFPGPTQSGVTTSVTMNYGSFATRQSTFTNSFVVSSATGISVGGFLRLEYDSQQTYFGGTETYEFDQIVKVGGVSGTTITPFESVKIPLATANFTGTPTVTVLALQSNVKVSGITIDGSALTGGGWQGCIYYLHLRNSLFTDVTCKNTTRYGIVGGQGYRNAFTNLRFDTVATDAQGGALYSFRESGDVISNFTAVNSPFAFLRQMTVSEEISNVTTNAGGPVNAGRGCKFLSVAYVQVSNADCSDNTGGTTGFSVQAGSYRNQFTNIIANNFTGGGAPGGIHFSGEQNTWNVVQNAIAYGNNNDYELGTTDSFNVINGFSGLTTSDSGTNNEVSWAYRERQFASSSINQSITMSGVAQALTWDTNGDPNTGGMHSTSSNPTRFTVSVPGYFSAICVAEFASNATGYRQVFFAKNGSGLTRGISNTGALTGQVTVVQATLAPTVMAVNDYLECDAAQSSGGALNVDSNNSYMFVKREF